MVYVDEAYVSSPFSCMSLMTAAFSQIASGSKAGSPSLPYPAFLAEISLERLSMSSTSLPRDGLEKKFGELGAPGVLRTTEPMQSEIGFQRSFLRHLSGH